MINLEHIGQHRSNLSNILDSYHGKILQWMQYFFSLCVKKYTCPSPACVSSHSIGPCAVEQIAQSGLLQRKCLILCTGHCGLEHGLLQSIVSQGIFRDGSQKSSPSGNM